MHDCLDRVGHVRKAGMQQYVRTHTYRGEYAWEAGFKGFFFKISPMVDNNGPTNLNENQWLDFFNCHVAA